VVTGGEGIGPDARTIVGQLASPTRLRVVCALALGARRPRQIAERAGVTEEEVSAALNRLLRAGIVVADAGTFALRPDVFARAARAASSPRRVESFGTVDRETARVLRAFVVDGRLTVIPAAGRKRRVVLEYVASAFEPGRRYDEQSVNATLRARYDDVAALRRYLVDEGLLSRDHGEYWRSGGWVDVRE
jgi:hypothetical protein